MIYYENYIIYAAANLLPVLNSVINPAILISRGSRLQDYIKQAAMEIPPQSVKLVRIFVGKVRNVRGLIFC